MVLLNFSRHGPVEWSIQKKQAGDEKFYVPHNMRSVERLLTNGEDKRGFSTHHLGLVYTLFSASNYCGTAGNKAMATTSYHAADTRDSTR